VIVREILDNPNMSFDWFNDFKDTYGWLVNCGHGAEADRLLERKEEEEAIKKQQKFVEFLKSNNAYNPMESAHCMRRMHRVWELCGEPRK
jgi:hypothetical protein